jgi:hypothetical protein
MEAPADAPPLPEDLLAEPCPEAPGSPPGVSQRVGRVLRAEGGRFVVLTGGERVTARRARSCLIEPRASDLVLVARVGRGGTSWVLSVLDGPGDDATLAFAGDVMIKSPGAVTVASGEATNLYSRGALGVAVDEVQLSANAVEASVDRASWIGRVFTSRLDAVKTFATLVDRVATRVSERAQRVYRTTEQSELLKVGQLDIRADDSITAQSKNTVMTAEQLVKLTGDQIHLG